MYLCIVKYYWGRGETEAAAMKAAKAAGGKLDRYIIMETSDPGAYVDGYGMICRDRDTTLREVRRHPASRLAKGWD